MKHNTFVHILPRCSGALALGLLVNALSASALQTTTPAAKPGSIQAAPASARSGHTNLTPATPVASKVPASSEEDIRDIRQPRHLPSPIAWVVVAAGVILLSAAAFSAWKWIRRGKFLAMAPYEIALQQLAEARRLMDPEHAREYCFAVSEIIRNYLEVQFHTHAPRLTTEEFLRDLVEVREMMLASHRALLGEFLQHCDLAKFAGWRYSRPALEEMYDTATNFVQQSAVDAGAPLHKGADPLSSGADAPSSGLAVAPENATAKAA